MLVGDQPGAEYKIESAARRQFDSDSPPEQCLQRFPTSRHAFTRWGKVAGTVLIFCAPVSQETKWPQPQWLIRLKTAHLTS